MKIKHISVVFILILAVMLTACGGKTNTPAPTVTTSRTEDNGNSDNNNGVFDPNNIGINNGNNDNNGTFNPNNIGVGDSNNNNDNNVDMTGHEPQGSGNFQDYWQGDSYFDLKEYALANGITHVFWQSGSGEYVDASDGIVMYLLDNDHKWGVYVYTNNVNLVYIAKLDPRKEYRAVLPETPVDGTMVTICKDNNAQITMDKLQAIITAIDCIKQSPNDENPFENSGLSFDY